MAQKIDYKKLYTVRSDGRYQGHWREPDNDGNPVGKRHTIVDSDPERLFRRIEEKQKPKIYTFCMAADDWSGYRFEQLSYKSVEAYRAPLHRLKDTFGARALNDIEAGDVAAFLKLLAAQQYAKRTVQMHRDMMSQIYCYAIASGKTRYSPVDHVQLPKRLPSGTRGIPSDEAISAVMTKSTEHPFGLFALICLYTGLRRGEALALQYSDIDKAHCVIHVTKAVEYIGNRPHLKEPKTAAGHRDVLLPKVLAAMIPKGKGYLFCRDDGSLISKDRYSDRWASYCKHIGYKITAHQLRHAYATMLFEAGLPDKDKQELLGHADIETTNAIYTHIRVGHREKVAKALNRYFQDSTQKVVSNLESKNKK